MQIGEKKRIASFIGITSSVYKRQIGCGIFPNIEKSGYIINEFASAGVPLIALVDSNMNSYKISFPIPGNDDSFVSINFFLNVMAKTCLAAKASFVLR
jgi:ribosomal protein S2